jgi:hypothetical protein
MSENPPRVRKICLHPPLHPAYSNRNPVNFSATADNHAWRKHKIPLDLGTFCDHYPSKLNES